MSSRTWTAKLQITIWKIFKIILLGEGRGRDALEQSCPGIQNWIDRKYLKL